MFHRQKYLSVSHTSRRELVIDLGATIHICHDKRMFLKLKEVQCRTMSLGDKSSVLIVGRGTVCLRL